MSAFFASVSENRKRLGPDTSSELTMSGTTQGFGSGRRGGRGRKACASSRTIAGAGASRLRGGRIPRPMTRFQKLTLTTAAATHLLGVWGAVVRVTNSGLGCPDWPLCYGGGLPPPPDPPAPAARGPPTPAAGGGG